jgi:hypothetical protein
MPAAGSTRRFGPISRAMMVGGLTVGLALGGAGIAFAATSGSSTPSTTTPSNSKPAPGPGHPYRGFRAFGPGGPRAFGGLGRVLHGQFTTGNASNHHTVEVQIGKVTAVSSTSITVQSVDGYSHSYAVASSTMVDATRDGIGSVKVGDQVQVLATTVKEIDTATNIVDTTQIGASRKAFGFGPGPGQMPTPAPSPAKPTTPATQSAAV